MLSVFEVTLPLDRCLDREERKFVVMLTLLSGSLAALFVRSLVRGLAYRSADAIARSVGGILRMALVVGFAVLALHLLVGCASRSTAPADGVSHIIETSLPDQARASWAVDTITTEEANGRLLSEGRYDGLGSERISLCYRMADARISVQLAEEIGTQVKSELISMTEGLDERVDPAVIENVMLEAKAEVRGLRIGERYHERRIVNGTERVACFSRGSISLAEFERAKAGLRTSLLDRSPELKKLILDRQKKFLKPSQPDGEQDEASAAQPARTTSLTQNTPTVKPDAQVSNARGEQ